MTERFGQSCRSKTGETVVYSSCFRTGRRPCLRFGLTGRPRVQANTDPEPAVTFWGWPYVPPQADSASVPLPSSRAQATGRQTLHNSSSADVGAPRSHSERQGRSMAGRTCRRTRPRLIGEVRVSSVK